MTPVFVYAFISVVSYSVFSFLLDTCLNSCKERALSCHLTALSDPPGTARSQPGHPPGGREQVADRAPPVSHPSEPLALRTVRTVYEKNAPTLTSNPIIPRCQELLSKIHFQSPKENRWEGTAPWGTDPVPPRCPSDTPGPPADPHIPLSENQQPVQLTDDSAQGRSRAAPRPPPR